MSETTARRQRSDGLRSRNAILDAATQLATVDGLEGLSIGNLASHIGMSKSGLYAHFGSKEELQLATIEAARQIFVREVIEPARDAPRGLARIAALAHEFLGYLSRGVFEGGCFFASAAAELDTHAGPVRDRVAELQASFPAYLAKQAEVAKEQGELADGEDPEQLAFEIYAFLLAANNGWVLRRDDDAALRAAERAVAARLARARRA